MAKTKGSKIVGKSGGKTGGKTGGKSGGKKGSIKVISVPNDLQKGNGGGDTKTRKIGMFVLGLVIVGLVVAIIVVSVPVIKKKYKQMKRRRLAKQFMNSIFGNVVSTLNTDTPPALQSLISRIKADYTSSNPNEDLIKRAALIKQTNIPDKISKAITSLGFYNDENEYDASLIFKYLNNKAQVSQDIADLKNVGVTYAKEIFDAVSQTKEMYRAYFANNECSFKKAAMDLLNLPIDSNNSLHLNERKNVLVDLRNDVNEKTYYYYQSSTLEDAKKDRDFQLC